MMHSQSVNESEMMNKVNVVACIINVNVCISMSSRMGFYFITAAVLHARSSQGSIFIAQIVFLEMSFV